MMRFFVLLLLTTLLLSACSSVTPPPLQADDENMDMSGGSMPANALDPQTTENGLFTVSAVSHLDPVVINETHTWTLHIETADGEPVTDAEIAVDGGMPAHNHGFPTAPRVTENLGDGDYLLEGMRFNMGGMWVMTLEIRSGDQNDSLTFEFELK